MKKHISVLSLSTVMIFCAALLCGCGTTQTEPRITQVAIIDTLLGGMYDGSATVGQLKSWGNIGIGTMHQLDGEMLVVDGVVYQVKYDGTVNRPADSETIPFATVVNFVPTKKIQLKNIKSFKDFEKQVPKYIANRNVPVAIHFKGKFSFMHTRSVERQKKPYRPLIEASKNQAEFKFKNISGDMVGFLFPKYVKGMNVPGWHVHFVDKDRRCGGHILDFSLLDGELEICEIYDFRAVFPAGSDHLAKLDLNKDRGQELKKVESSRE
jgi:acetolactate decarboxylase